MFDLDGGESVLAGRTTMAHLPLAKEPPCVATGTTFSTGAAHDSVVVPSGRVPRAPIVMPNPAVGVPHATGDRWKETPTAAAAAAVVAMTARAGPFVGASLASCSRPKTPNPDVVAAAAVGLAAAAAGGGSLATAVAAARVGLSVDLIFASYFRPKTTPSLDSAGLELAVVATIAAAVGTTAVVPLRAVPFVDSNFALCSPSTRTRWAATAALALAASWNRPSPNAGFDLAAVAVATIVAARAALFVGASLALYSPWKTRNPDVVAAAVGLDLVVVVVVAAVTTVPFVASNSALCVRATIPHPNVVVVVVEGQLDLLLLAAVAAAARVAPFAALNFPACSQWTTPNPDAAVADAMDIPVPQRLGRIGISRLAAVGWHFRYRPSTILVGR